MGKATYIFQIGVLAQVRTVLSETRKKRGGEVKTKVNTTSTYLPEEEGWRIY